jgi:hypothetical protein
MLWLEPNHYIKTTEAGQFLVENKQAFVGKHVYRAFTGYAHAQLQRMTHYVFEGYMGEKRKRLVDKFGYDTKNAAHLIRLLRMGIEFLKDGRLYVFRHDAKELLEIKRGEWGLERVKQESDYLFKKSEEAYFESKLPASTNPDTVNSICVNVIRIALGL